MVPAKAEVVMIQHQQWRHWRKNASPLPLFRDNFQYLPMLTFSGLFSFIISYFYSKRWRSEHAMCVGCKNFPKMIRPFWYCYIAFVIGIWWGFRGRLKWWGAKTYLPRVYFSQCGEFMFSKQWPLKDGGAEDRYHCMVVPSALHLHILLPKDRWIIMFVVQNHHKEEGTCQCSKLGLKFPLSLKWMWRISSWMVFIWAWVLSQACMGW